MNQARVGLLVAAALLAAPGLAHAQGKPDKGKPPAAAGGDKPAEAKDGAKGGDASGDKKDEKPADKPADGAGGSPGGDTAEPGGICELDPSQCPQLDLKKEAEKPITAQMYAVQQKYALRARRVEINPYWGFTLNDQFVSHNAPGLAVNYYVTDVLAVGANYNAYRIPFGNLNRDSEFNAQARRAARIAVPLTEYDWGAAVNFTYVPMYGKFAGFGDFIFHYDFYVVGGFGVLSNRPIAVIDPDNRSFQSKINLSPNAGLGLRIFFNRWFSAILEVRDYIFFDKLENTTIAVDTKQQQNESTWYADGSTFTNNVQAQIGVSVFLPFSFEYRLPK